MATGRQPKAKGENTKPEILRTVRVGEHDLYGPGEEDEFLEALQEHLDEINPGLEANDRPTIDINDELVRLSTLGHIINFEGVEIDDDDMEHGDQDLLANQTARKRALVEAPGDEGTPSTDVRTRRRRVKPTKGVELNPKKKRTNDGSDAAEGEGEGEEDEGK